MKATCPWVLFLGIFSSCTNPSEEAVLPFSAWCPIQLGEETIEVQVAHRSQEVSRGLMYRDNLEQNRGMLFYYDSPREMSFWMRNTRHCLGHRVFHRRRRPSGNLPHVPHG